MKITVALACIYIILNSVISHWVNQGLTFRPTFSTINDLFFTLEKNINSENDMPGGNAENGKTILGDFNASVTNIENVDVQQQEDLAEQTLLKHGPEIQKYFVHVENERIYIYSAIVHQNNVLGYSTGTRAPGSNISDFVAVNGWRHNASDPELKCCYILDNQKISKSSKILAQDVHYYNSSLRAVQYRCPYFRRGPGQIIGIGLSNRKSMCPTSTAYYLNPVRITKRGKGSIGVCCKLSYGSIKTGPLVEWFEALRLFGVDKIFSYNGNLSSEAQKVFDHYRSIGLLEYFPFDVPEKDKYPREMGEIVTQAWTDEQVIIFDCQERLNAFQYAVFLDKDEILLPKKIQLKNSWKLYFGALDGDIVGQRYFSEIHLTDWTPSNPNHPLFIGQYTVGSSPVKNTVKYMFRPPFVPSAQCHAHNFILFNGTRVPYAPWEDITLHHFRSCQTYRKPFKNGTFCIETDRSPSREVANLADYITDNVLNVLDTLRNL